MARRAARWRWLAGLALLIGLSVIAGGAVMAINLQRAYASLQGAGAVVVSTPEGEIQYKRSGAGVPVLVIHGSGGGFDQGELIARAVLGEGFDWIAPSRFGYLRSSVRAGATFDDQARAYAHLLDRLGVERVAVVAMSHGGPSALLFAALYPQRVASLTLISCGVAASASAEQAEASRKGDALTAIFRFDALYWLASQLARSRLLQLMGAEASIVAELGPGERELIDRVVDGMNPVAPRAAGVAFDNRAAMPNERIAAIRAPTLVLHARDDRLQLYHNAEFAAAHIPGARLLPFEQGGHLLIAIKQPQIRAEVTRFIRSHSDRHSGR